MDFNEDAYWENRREEYEGSNKTVVAKCRDCNCDLCDGSECYCVNGRFYCEECMSDYKVTIELEE